jgi:iron-sulfur cluster repair protein YtfE (RIC family)
LKKIEESLEDLRHAHRALADHVQRALDPERGLGHDVKKELNALREELKNHFKEESKVLLEDIGKQQGQINKSKQSGLVT